MLVPFLSSKKSRSASEYARGPERYEALAEAAMDAGDLESAIEHYQAALELSPLNQRLRIGLADVLMAHAEHTMHEGAAGRQPGDSRVLKQPKRITGSRAKQSASFHEPKPMRSAKEALSDARRLATEDLGSETPSARRSPGMAEMDQVNAAKGSERRSTKVAQADEVQESEFPRERPAMRRSSSPRPRKSTRSPRFLVAAVLYGALSLVLLGVAHAVINQVIVDHAPLPEVPKIEPLPEAVAEALEIANRELYKGNPSPAVDILEKTVADYPKHSEMLNAALSQSLRAQGNRLLDNRDYAKAGETFERATRVDPLNVNNWIEMGRSFREHGRSIQASSPGDGRELLERARDAYIRALDVGPNDPAALLGLAQVYGFLGERGRAVENYQQVLVNSPEGKEAALARQHLEQLVGKS